MNRFSALLLVSAFSLAQAFAQTRDLVVFSDDGQKFTLIVDGDVKNAEPASRVVAPGIRNETPLCVVRFEDKSIADIKQNTWLEAGKEYTMVVTTNKKGLRVLRPQGEAEQGTAAKAEAAKPKPTDFQADDERPVTPPAKGAQQTVTQDVSMGGVQQTTTVTVVEESGGDGQTEGVNMSMGINGLGVNMNVGVTETGGGATSTTRTTTTRTTTTTTTTGTLQESPAPSKVTPAEPYRMPGYTGPIGCDMPMSSTEFADVKKSIESKGFEESKMTMVKQIGRDRCFSVEQVKGIMGLFSFEESKLDFAKFAYDRVHDKGNFYKVNDAFSFESTIDELNEYIQSR